MSFFMDAQTLPSSSKPTWSYDVFLSFRGEDTRKKFTDHLYTALKQAGVHTFRDDEELPRGELISTELINAIRASRIAIVVFSKDYASSSWCLDELVEILHCKKTVGQIFFPIFYDVNPSDVRKQIGTFAGAFVRHEERFRAEMERVKKWRAALIEAASFSGWDLRDVANGYESTFIKKILEEVLRKVNKVQLHVAAHPVGIGSRVEQIKDLLNLGTNDVRIVGIFGMGGIGKTTIAKAVYNELCLEFEGSSFLLNIKEISEKPDGLVRLQEQLLSDVLKKENLKISNVDGGISLIKERFRRKRVLIVLDDVDHLKQLNSLAGEVEWFGPGSRVIATTRDEHVLTLLGVNEKYMVEELNNEESLQLFSWHAFRMANPAEEYLKLSTDVVGYVGGLPLALEVLGSSLLRRTTNEWKSTLEKLQKVPDKQIQGKLRISFDSLDVTEKDIFLDIACFFIGTDKEYVNRVLDGCGFFPDIGISILIQRSLLTVNERNELRMHDLIRDMGREIVREESPNDLGERNRLWFHEDVLNVLRKHTGSKAVQGVILNMPTLEDVHFEAEAFREMKNLRLLQIDGVYLKGCYELLPKELKWLCWHKCPLQFLPPNFQLESLAVLDMQHSNVKQVWREIKIFNKLKVLNMSNSIYLTKSPNFLRVPLLEIMILEGCTSLTEIHESIGHLKSLVLLNLKGCKNLRNLPRSICNSKSLETLNLSGCSKLTMLPKDFGYMMALRELRADKTAIKQLPSSFGLLTNLQTLTLSGCKEHASESWISRILSLSGILPSSNPTNLLPVSISGLCSLRELDLSDCSLREDGIPIDFGSLSSLEELDLSGNSFLKLPPCMSRLPKLAKLRLNDCTSLQLISELPTSVTELKAARCTSLERVSNLFNLKRWSSISLSECNKLVEIQGLEKLQFAITHTDEGYNVSYFFSKNIFQSSNLQSLWGYPFHPGREVPDRFSHKKVGSSISCHVPPLSEGKIVGVDVCAVFAPKKETTAEPVVRSLEIKSRFFTNQSHWFDEFREGTTFMTSIPMSNFKAGMASGKEINVSFDFGEAFEVKECGIYLRLIEEAEPDVIDEDEQGSLVKDVDFVTGADTAMDMVYMKRGRDEHEAGSSNDWSIQESCPKRSRLEAEAYKKESPL